MPNGRISIPALLIRQGEKIEAMKQELFANQANVSTLSMELKTAQLEKKKLQAAMEKQSQDYQHDAEVRE